MNIDFKKISPENYNRTYEILRNSFPDMSIAQERANEWFDKILADSEKRILWGAFQGKKQIASFITFNFELNFRGQLIPAGGIGALAVELLYKKEKVCKKIIEFFHDYYSSQATNLLVLYPFRPDFYMKMGFGLGSSLHTYAIEAKYFPLYPKEHVIEYATIENLQEISKFYNLQALKTHGAMLRDEREFEGYLKNPKMRCIVYRNKEKELKGYIFFAFVEENPQDKGNFDLKIKEMQYSGVDVWRQFSTFLHTQSDQVKRIQITSFDPDFYHYFSNPTNSSKQYYSLIQQNIACEKSGVMYKIIEPARFLSQLQANTFTDSDLIIKFELENELFPQNGKFILTYNFATNNIVKNDEKVDLTIKMNYARFSSILMGSLSFRAAFKHGLIELDKENYIDCVDKLFKTKDKPVTYNEF